MGNQELEKVNSNRHIDRLQACRSFPSMHKPELDARLQRHSVGFGPMDELRKSSTVL